MWKYLPGIRQAFWVPLGLKWGSENGYRALCLSPTPPSQKVHVNAQNEGEGPRGEMGLGPSDRWCWRRSSRGDIWLRVSGTLLMIISCCPLDTATSFILQEAHSEWGRHAGTVSVLPVSFLFIWFVCQSVSDAPHLSSQLSGLILICDLYQFGYFTVSSTLTIPSLLASFTWQASRTLTVVCACVFACVPLPVPVLREVSQLTLLVCVCVLSFLEDQLELRTWLSELCLG